MKILTAITEVGPYLPQVQSLADLNKEALGFLPTSAYSEQAQRGRLWVAAEEHWPACRIPSLRRAIPKSQNIPGICLAIGPQERSRNPPNRGARIFR